MIYLLWNEFGSNYFKHAAIFRRVAAVQIFVRLLLWIWQLNAPLVELITDMSLSAISDITLSAYHYNSNSMAPALAADGSVVFYYYLFSTQLLFQNSGKT